MRSHNREDTTRAFFGLPAVFPPRADELAIRRAHEIIIAYTLAFFDKYLRGRDSDLLAAPSDRYPEVTFQKRAGRK